MKTITIITAFFCVCLSSCADKEGNRIPIKFSIFSTEYGASATYSKEGGLNVGLDADRIKAAIVDRESGK